MAFGVYFALQDLSPNGEGASIDYFEGFKAELYTSLIAVGIHTAFICIYTSLDTSIIQQISEGAFWSRTTSPLMTPGFPYLKAWQGVNHYLQPYAVFQAKLII